MDMAKTQPRPNGRATPRSKPDRIEPWKNTRPRANPEADRRDVERSTERLEMLLGH
jgi:hypothetical protein